MTTTAPGVAAVTLGHSGTRGGMHTRHGPPQSCAICGNVVPTDQTIVRVKLFIIETRNFMGTYEHAEPAGHVMLCGPCWDTAPPDPDPWAPDPRRNNGHAPWRRVGDAQFRIGRRPGQFPCAWCGRPVLADVSRRKYPSCSKRCQVYTSQQHHGTTRDRYRRPRAAELACRSCGASFAPRTYQQKFCSHACRQRAYRVWKAANDD